MNSKEQIAFLKDLISLLETQNGKVELTGVGIDSGEFGTRAPYSWSPSFCYYMKGNFRTSFPDGVNWNLFIPIESMDIPLRAHHCLSNVGVKYAGEVIQLTATELLRTKNFGRKSMYAIRDWLREKNLDFGMKIDDWPEMLASVGLKSCWSPKKSSAGEE